MAATGFTHQPVMPDEVLHYLQPVSGGLYLDGTVGGGGHARLLLDKAPDSRLIGLDRDPAALQEAGRVLQSYADRVVLKQATFDQLTAVLTELDQPLLNGMLLDLGVSSHQLDTAERGFSFQSDAPLDMRMDPTSGETAADLLNQTSEDELRRIFFTYGEERFSRRIARAVVQQRQEQPIERTGQLAELIRKAIPGGQRPGRIHPATRVFQALRIQVNDELGQISRGLAAGIAVLKPSGRLVVISFHSLEDRIVKQLFREWARSCVCPPKLPVCQCGKQPEVRILTRKAVKARTAEVDNNPRARSAVLRAVERC